MKTLILLRHAKSDWDDPTRHDHDRPLNKRGERDAPAMGNFLREKGVIPDLIVSSTALRAKTTAEAVATGAGYDPAEIVFRKELYLPPVETLLSTTKRLPKDKEKVMLVAHNPGITSFLATITGNYQTVPEMPTCAVAVLELDGEWEAAARGAFNFKAFYTPKKDLF